MMYLDSAASSGINFNNLKQIIDNETLFVNPSSSHYLGYKSLEILQKARGKIAFELKCKPEEIIFTSGGTESNNLVIQGSFLNSNLKHPHIITSQIEHHSVLNTCKYLEKQGCEVTYLTVNRDGVVSVSDLEHSIKNNTILISIMTVNNETGVLQPVKNISEIAKKHKIPFHSDCVQALSYFATSQFNIKDYDFISLSGHKFGTFPGIGILYIKKRNMLQPVLYGGNQEGGLRPGTESPLSALFMAENLSSTLEFLRANSLKRNLMRDKLLRKMINIFEGNIRINGKSSNNIINVSFKNLDGRVIQSLLSEKGYAVGVGSACSSNGDEQVSHVLKAMNVPEDFIRGSIRISPEWCMTQDDIDEFVEALYDTINYLYEVKGGE